MLKQFFDHAKIVDLVPDKNRNQPWHVTPILDLPFAHRMTILDHNATKWFVGATLATAKDKMDDWSHPGEVVAGHLPDRPGTPLEVQTILTGVRRNHGLHRSSHDGTQTLLISGMDGLYSLTPPQEGNKKWQADQLLGHDVSDMVLHDIDGDGPAELMTIEPFHGDQLVIYRGSLEMNRIDIDTGTGPANVSVIHLPDYDVILSANHAIGQVAVYHIYDH